MQYECEITPLSSDRHKLGEGPYYDQGGNKLYMIDWFDCNVLSYDLGNGNKVTTKNVSAKCSFIIPYEDDPNRFLISKTTYNESGVWELNWESGETKKLADVGKTTTHLNDGKCDRNGRLWTGTIGRTEKEMEFEEGAGSVYTLRNNVLEERDTGITVSNGLGWTADDTIFYFADTIKNLIYAYDYDLSMGAISNRRVSFDFNTDLKSSKVNGFPDGMDVDSDGNLWVAMVGSGRVLHIDPNRRALIGYVEIPCLFVTSLCFGGHDLSTIYVTTGYMNMTEEERQKSPLAGAVFEVKLTNVNVKGARLNRTFRN